MASTKHKGKSRPSPATNACRKPRIAKSVAKKTIARAAEEATQTTENRNQAEHKPLQALKPQPKHGKKPRILAHSIKGSAKQELLRQPCATNMEARRKGREGLPEQILAQHLQSKEDTEAIKRWLCKHDPVGTRAGRRTKKGTFLDRARNIRAATIPLTPYMEKKFMDAIDGRTSVVQHYRSVGGEKDDNLTRQHQAFVETLKTCLHILTGGERPAHSHRSL